MMKRTIKEGNNFFSQNTIDLIFGNAFPFHQFLKKNREMRKLLTPEFLEELSKWKWKEDEPHVNQKIGLSIASAFYGRHLDNPDAIYTNAQKLTNNTSIPNITQNSGFTELFQAGQGFSEAQYLLTEMIVAKRLVEKSLLGLQKRPKDVDLFIVATSVPSDHNLEQKLAQSAGVSKRTPKFLYVRACDSSGSALFDVQSGKYDYLLNKKTRHGKPATVTIFGFEDANRLSNKGGDPFSAQLFSTAASAMSFSYHPHSEKSTFKLITGKHSSVAKGAEALQVYKSYKNWPQKANAVFADYLIEPSNGQVIFMDPKMTPVVFKSLGLEAVAEVLEAYSQTRGRSRHSLSASTKKVIMHHPSATIFNHVVAGLTGKKGKSRKGETGLGFKENQFSWVISEGNAPSAVMPIALGRQLHDLNPKDIIMVLTYGAGGSFTCAFYRIGRG